MINYNVYKPVLTAMFKTIKGEKSTITHFDDLNDVRNLLVKNRISNIFYYTIYENRIVLDEHIEKAFKTDCLFAAKKMSFQKNVASMILSALNAEEVEVIFLKGIVLKDLYYKEDMRVMGDIDLLVASEYYDKSKLILSKLGFSLYKEDSLECCFVDKQNNMVELHRHLVSPYSPNFDFFSNYRKHCCKIDNYFSLDYKFQFIYMLDHIHKHFNNGGLSFKYIFDFVLYIEKYPTVIDETILDLKKCKLHGTLTAFLLVSNRILDVDLIRYNYCIDREFSEKTLQRIISLVLFCGEYGNSESVRLSYIASKGYFGTLIDKIFVPDRIVRKNKLYFSLLILIYPLFVIYRLGLFIFLDSKKIFFHIKNRKLKKDISKTQITLNY